MEIVRGDLIIAAAPGDYGKPRPTLVIQSNTFSGLAGVTLLPLTSDLQNFPFFRINLDPGPENGLRLRSQIMIDKAVTLSRRKLGQRIGRVDPATMHRVDAALIRFLGLE